uniref:Cytochrome c oxidase subunit 3 n=1 Tax=Imerinia grandidieri TaxID=3244470 RepID=G8HQY2_9EUPU|nr:cytochrome c oxidase subunit III [Rhopalocaulis grandidieri]
MTPWHLVQQSPWPIICSFSVFSIPIGFVTWVHRGEPELLVLGLLLTVFISFLWWRDVVREGTFQGFHSSLVARGLKIGMGLFIASEVFFFLAFFWAYFHSSLAPAVEIGGVWPPVGITPLNAFQVPLLNTSVLLLSGVSITWAHHGIIEKQKLSSVVALAFTLVLGFYFLFLQYGEYQETSFSIADSVYGSTFFVATGFHGLHVAVGATFLTVCFLRLIYSHFSSDHHVGFLSAAWYWHFVDVVWLFLYTSIYWWGS